MTDLIAEINNAGDASAALALLREAGVSDRVLLSPAGICGAFGLAPVEPIPDGKFQPSEDAREAIIIAVRDERDEIADLIAWRPGLPDRWRRRLGVATFANESAIREAAFFRKPLRLHETPLAWLRAGCLGAVILDPLADIRADLDGVSEIKAETLELGREISRQLAERTSFRRPIISVPEPAARAA